MVTEGMAVVPFPSVVFRPLENERVSFHAIWSVQNANPALWRMLSMAKAMSKTVVGSN